MSPFELLRAGFRIFPLRPGTKTPAVQGYHGKDPQVASEEQVQAWVTANPAYGWGIATGSGLTVLDVDVKNGVNGFDSLHGAVPDWRDDFDTRTVETPSGGRHYYFAGDLGSIGAAILPGVDYRSTGGFVVAPGTTLPNGTYQLIDPSPIASAPGWLGLLIGRATASKGHPITVTKAAALDGTPESDEGVLKRVANLATTVATATPGTGNTVLNAEAFKAGQYLGAGQLDRDTVREMFVRAFDSWVFRDSDHEATTHRTLDHALDAGMADPRPWTRRDTEATVDDKAAIMAMGARLHRSKSGPATGPMIIPGPDEMLGATTALAEAWRTPYGYSLNAEQDDLFEWLPTKAYWRRLMTVDAANRVLKVLGRCTYQTRNGTHAWPTSPTKVKEVQQTLAASVLYRDDVLDAREVPAYSAVYCRNGRVDIATGELHAPDPALFNKSALPFDYDAGATAPRWLAFLKEALPQDSIDTLQEWFGYVVSGRKDLQKILCLIGKPRAGKGTVTTVLEDLVGSDFVSTPTLGGFAGTFGRESLIGASLVVFNEADWGAARHTEAVSLLKGISGNDSQTINRKNRIEWQGRLDCRIMIVSNDAPQFNDPSGAMAKRLIVLRFENSAEGREDPELGRWLRAELSGILNWALEGARRLNARGRFELPESAVNAKREAENQSSITAQFLAEHAIVDPSESFDARALRAALNAWQERDGVGRQPLSLQTMIRELEALTGVRVVRTKSNGARGYTVEGVGPAWPGAFADAAQGKF